MSIVWGRSGQRVIYRLSGAAEALRLPLLWNGVLQRKESEMGGPAKSSSYGREFFVPMPSVMLDIETTGADTKANAIIQIGAARFTENFTVISTFDRVLRVPGDRWWDAGTRDWWSREAPEVLDRIQARMSTENSDHIEVLRDFRKWLPYGAFVWAWPAHFDCSFLLSYAKSYLPSLANAAYPSRWIDSRSWISGVRRGWISHREVDDLAESVKADCVEHDGLSDALWQVRCLKAIAGAVRAAESRDSLWGGVSGGGDGPGPENRSCGPPCGGDGTLPTPSDDSP